MDFKFGKDADNSAGTKQAASGEKNRQTGLLLVLLMLVGGGGYLYFFTDLIKPQAEQKPAAPPPPQVVKKPLPTGTAPAAPEKKEGAAQPAAIAQAVPAAQPAKEQPKTAQVPVKPEPAKSAATAKPQPVVADTKAQKPAETPKSAAAAKPAAEQKVTASSDKKAAAADKKSTEIAGAKKVAEAKAAAEKKPAAVAAKPVSAPAKSAKTAKPARKATAVAKSSAGPWTVVVGSYMLEDAMAADLAKVRKAGLQAGVKPGDRKKTAMHRLFLAEYPDRATAQAALDKLKKNTSDAFVLGQGGKYAVYAGSYLLDSRATSEKERLAAAGYGLTMKSAEVAIQSKSLTAGTFPDKKAADAAVAKLKSEGLKATLQH